MEICGADIIEVLFGRSVSWGGLMRDWEETVAPVRARQESRSSVAQLGVRRVPLSRCSAVERRGWQAHGMMALVCNLARIQAGTLSREPWCGI